MDEAKEGRKRKVLEVSIGSIGLVIVVILAFWMQIIGFLLAFFLLCCCVGKGIVYEEREIDKKEGEEK